MSIGNRLYLFFDTETGGIDPNKNPLLTAYFGIFDSNFKLIDELDLKLIPNPNLKIEQEALDVCGINMETHLKEAIMPEEGAKLLIALLDKYKIPKKRKHYTPCAYNFEFDIKFVLTHLINANYWDKYVHHNPIDPLRILTVLIDSDLVPQDLGNLESVVKHFNLPQLSAHNAKDDTLMLVEVYKHIKGLIKNISTINANIDPSTISSKSILNIVERSS